MISNPVITSTTLPTPAVEADPSKTYIRLALNPLSPGCRNHERTLAALDTETVQEVVMIPNHRLSVMPNMASAVMGLLNHRSRVIWVVDLSQLLGLSPLNPRPPEHHLAILQAGGISLGLAIREVQGITRILPTAITSTLAPDLPSDMTPYLRGCVMPETRRPDQKPLLILDAEAIAAYSA